MRVALLKEMPTSLPNCRPRSRRPACHYVPAWLVLISLILVLVFMIVMVFLIAASLLVGDAAVFFSKTLLHASEPRSRIGRGTRKLTPRHPLVAYVGTFHTGSDREGKGEKSDGRDEVSHVSSDCAWVTARD